MAAQLINLPAAPDHTPFWMAPASNTAPQQLVQDFRAQRQLENWKYTPVSPYVDALARHMGAAPPPTIAGADGVGVSLYSISSSDDSPVADSIGPDAASNPDTLHNLTQHIELAEPLSRLMLLHATTLTVVSVASRTRANLQINHHGSDAPVLLLIGRNAEVNLVERWTDTGKATSELTGLFATLAEASRLHHSRLCTSTPDQSWQLLQVILKKDAQLDLSNLAVGGNARRQDIRLHLTEPGAHANVVGAGAASNSEHLDVQLTLEHSGPDTTSEERFHNIASGKAHVTFNGRIHIHKHASGVQAELTNRNLIDGNAAVVNTKPELEIYNDDVKCAHGATVGQLDEDAYFFLLARGLAPEQARRLLAEAFLGACLTGPLAAEAREAMLLRIGPMSIRQ